MGGTGARFDFDEEKGVFITCDDVDFSSFGVFKVAVEDFMAVCLERAHGDFFTKETNALGADFRAAGIEDSNGLVERPA